MLPEAVGGSRVLVGIDGGDGAGKTTFADDLAATLARSSTVVRRVSLDDFHNPRDVRYRRGRTSASGFWLDSFDYERFLTYVVRPLAAGGNGRYRARSHDLGTDEFVYDDEHLAPPGSVVLVDGLFLHRDELRGCWDFSVFLDVPYEVTAQRMALRDGANPDPHHPTMRRYTEGNELYRRQCDPRTRADVVIDNVDPEKPVLLMTRPHD